jgi:hypothetical protein
LASLFTLQRAKSFAFSGCGFLRRHEKNASLARLQARPEISPSWAIAMIFASRAIKSASAWGVFGAGSSDVGGSNRGDRLFDRGKPSPYASYDGATLPIINTVAGRMSGAGGFPVDLVIKPVVQTIRSEIVYKFNWNGPVAAKF